MSNETALPRWSRALAVCAHPDDETFGLGAIIDELVRANAIVDLLTFTRGEASTLGARPDLADIRTVELENAARELGIRSVTLQDLPDGGLATHDPQDLRDRVLARAAQSEPEGLLCLDISGVSGHPDHIAATTAALSAAEELNIPVLAYMLPANVVNQINSELGASMPLPAKPADIELTVDRTAQMRAINAHQSQAPEESVLWRKLEIQGDRESLVWLRR